MYTTSAQRLGRWSNLVSMLYKSFIYRPRCRSKLTTHFMFTAVYRCVNAVNSALRRSLHNHGNIATEGNPKLGLCPTLIEWLQRFFISTVLHTPGLWTVWSTVYMHNHNDKHSTQPGFGPSTSDFRTTTGPNEPSWPAVQMFSGVYKWTCLYRNAVYTHYYTHHLHRDAVYTHYYTHHLHRDAVYTHYYTHHLHRDAVYTHYYTHHLHRDAVYTHYYTHHLQSHHMQKKSPLQIACVQTNAI